MQHDAPGFNIAPPVGEDPSDSVDRAGIARRPIPPTAIVKPWINKVNLYGSRAGDQALSEYTLKNPQFGPDRFLGQIGSQDFDAPLRAPSLVIASTFIAKPIR